MSHPQKRSRSEVFDKGEEMTLPVDEIFESLAALRDFARIIIQTGVPPPGFNVNRYDKSVDKVLERMREKWDKIIISLKDIVDDSGKTKSDEDFIVDDSDEQTESDYEPSEEEDCETIPETDSDEDECPLEEDL